MWQMDPEFQHMTARSTYKTDGSTRTIGVTHASTPYVDEISAATESSFACAREMRRMFSPAGSENVSAFGLETLLSLNHQHGTCIPRKCTYLN